MQTKEEENEKKEEENAQSPVITLGSHVWFQAALNEPPGRRQQVEKVQKKHQPEEALWSHST